MIKLQWLRGRSLGLAFIYLGIMTIFQLIFVVIGQFAMKVGSRPISVLIPIAVILTTFYCVLVSFESNTTMSDFRKTHHTKKKKNSKVNTKKAFKDFYKNIYVHPIILVAGTFALLFFLTWLILFALIDQNWVVFIVAENVGAIGVIVFTSFMERSTKRSTR